MCLGHVEINGIASLILGHPRPLIQQWSIDRRRHLTLLPQVWIEALLQVADLTLSRSLGSRTGELRQECHVWAIWLGSTLCSLVLRNLQCLMILTTAILSHSFSAPRLIGSQGLQCAESLILELILIRQNGRREILPIPKVTWVAQRTFYSQMVLLWL